MIWANWILSINSKNKWKKVTLVASTHWDEWIWFEVFKYLIEEFNIKEQINNWELNLVIWNLEWLKKDKKYIDTDLNRVWNFEEKDKNTYEYKRANEIKHILEKSDFVFDLHSTTNPSPFFIIPNGDLDKNYLKSFNCEYIIEDILDFLHGKPLIKYVSEKNPKSQTMVMECYWEKKDEIKKYINNVILFLNNTKIIDQELPFKIKKQSPIIYKVKKTIYAKSMNVEFLYSKKPQSFDKIRSWELVFIDNDKKYYAEDDFVILMPTKPRYVWEEIMYILEKS